MGRLIGPFNDCLASQQGHLRHNEMPSLLVNRENAGQRYNIEPFPLILAPTGMPDQRSGCLIIRHSPPLRAQPVFLQLDIYP